MVSTKQELRQVMVNTKQELVNTKQELHQEMVNTKQEVRNVQACTFPVLAPVRYTLLIARRPL